MKLFKAANWPIIIGLGIIVSCSAGTKATKYDGSDAAKIVLDVTPSLIHALYVDGEEIGHAPSTVLVQPGRREVEIHWRKMAHNLKTGGRQDRTIGQGSEKLSVVVTPGRVYTIIGKGIWGENSYSVKYKVLEDKA